MANAGSRFFGFAVGGALPVSLAAHWLAGFEILNDVVLNQVLVSYGDVATTQAVLAKVQEEGTCWASGTHWHG